MATIRTDGVAGKLSHDLAAADTTVTDGATTASSTTVTSATASFTSTDVGLPISGGSIPAGATISSVTNGTTVVISAAATATATAVSLTIRRGTFMQSAGLADLAAVASPNIAKITLFQQDTNGRITKREVVYVTAHTASATSATISRGQEGTTAQAWNGTTVPDSWVHAPSARDWSQSTKVRRASTTQSVANNTLTIVTFDTEDWDDEGIYNPGTDATKITVATAGRYRISATGAFDVTGGTPVVEQFSILVNGSAIIANVFTCPVSSPGLTSMSTMVNLSVSDYVQLQAYQNSGSAMSTNSTYPTSLVVERVA